MGSGQRAQWRQTGGRPGRCPLRCLATQCRGTGAVAKALRIGSLGTRGVTRAELGASANTAWQVAAVAPDSVVGSTVPEPEQPDPSLLRWVLQVPPIYSLVMLRGRQRRGVRGAQEERPVKRRGCATHVPPAAPPASQPSLRQFAAVGQCADDAH